MKVHCVSLFIFGRNPMPEEATVLRVKRAAKAMDDLFYFWRSMALFCISLPAFHIPFRPRPQAHPFWCLVLITLMK